MAIKLGNLTLYDLDELSKKLNVTPVTLRAYIRSGKLAGQKIGVRWFISEDALKEFFLKPTPRHKAPRPRK